MKLFDIRFSYKHCNFSRGCLLVKLASKTMTLFTGFSKCCDPILHHCLQVISFLFSSLYNRWESFCDWVFVFSRLLSLGLLIKPSARFSRSEDEISFKVFSVFSKSKHHEKLHCTFFTVKISKVFFSLEEPPQLSSMTTAITFPAKMTLVHAG